MPALVVDASFALAWALPDEISAYADAVLAAVETEGLRVPELWPREVANGLAISHLRKRLTLDDEQVFLDALSRLTINVDQSADALLIIRNGTAAASRYRLTAYDAAYVERAAREGLTLATLDERMRDAALKAGVAFLMLRPACSSNSIFINMLRTGGHSRRGRDPQRMPATAEKLREGSAARIRKPVSV